ncbi:MAG: phage virion morphogenesis protein [Betaproteobacteria bacterium]|nr:phage virion morphogenesis protein [Betaproteobacteria bacterium]
MSSFELTVDDQGVQSALKALADRVNNMQPLLQAVGDDIVERAKHRFDTSTGPDGQA